MPHFADYVPHYFRKHFQRRLEELYISVAMQDFALAAIVLFEPIYLYNLGFSISHILMYYIVVYGLYYFLAPAGGKFVARFGPERSMLLSTLMLIGYYLSLWLVAANPIFFWVAPVLFALQKMWYWPAYHTDFIRNSDQGERGKEYSGLWSLTTMMYVLGPIVGGTIIKLYGFGPLFFFVSVIILLSNIPMMIDQPHHQPEPFSYWRSLKLPWQKRHIKSALGYVALGEELMFLVIWPIFIALAFKDYLSIGGIVAVATLITAMVTLYVGKIIDRQSSRTTLRIGAWVTVVVWLTRPWLRELAAVFLSDTVGRIAKNTTFVSTATLAYFKAISEKDEIARAVFFEQGFAIGKTFIAAAAIVLIQFVSPFTASFLLAGAVSLCYLLL